MTQNPKSQIPSVKLVDGPSPLEGLVVLGSDGYVCYDGFNTIAANLVCRELGFPAAEKYSAQILPSTAVQNRTPLSCPAEDSYRVQRLRDCPTSTTDCSTNKTVRLKCREPGFLGCYEDNHQSFSLLSVTGFDVHSVEECTSTCRGEPRHKDIALLYKESETKWMCVCLHSAGLADLIPGGNYSHEWTCPSQEELGSGHLVYSLFNVSVGVCNPPGHVMNGHWNSNVTSYGSKITLTCGDGYIINGSATLQCVEQLGWSTYFPEWNASVPSCQTVEIKTTDTEWRPDNTTTWTTQSAVNTFSEYYKIIFF
ncbi:uncharacterized protein [Diadema setosum]|uniref:uncharacterized protein n=1 Tax=Diadema setosum TaxID=31175 RepID=UPI003B3B428D